MEGFRMVGMAKRKPTAPKGSGAEAEDSSNSKYRRVQLRPFTWGRLVNMAEKTDTPPNELGNRAVREFLEREGFWDDEPAGPSAGEGGTDKKAPG
jgi:hypothetical protein